MLKDSYRMDEDSLNVIMESSKKKVEKYNKYMLVRYIRNFIDDRKSIHRVKAAVKRSKISGVEYKSILNAVKQDISLTRKIERLVTMQNLFKYWHVAHLPFALVMLIIMIIHSVITVVFGYRWIF
jgi:hypothetical protein